MWGLVFGECAKRGLDWGIHTTWEESHWISNTESNWNLLHPQYTTRTKHGSPRLASASLAFPEVMAHKLRLVDERLAMKPKTVFLDLFRNGGWSPALEYVQPVRDAWRARHGGEPPDSATDPRWLALVSEWQMAYVRAFAAKCHAAGAPLATSGVAVSAAALVLLLAGGVQGTILRQFAVVFAVAGLSTACAAGTVVPALARLFRLGMDRVEPVAPAGTSPLPARSLGARVVAVEVAVALLLASAALVARMPRDYDTGWSGIAYEESSNPGRMTLVVALALLAVFLVLTVRFNSWRRASLALLPAAGSRSFGMTLLGGYLAYALAGLPLAAALKPAGDRRQERAGIC